MTTIGSNGYPLYAMPHVSTSKSKSNQVSREKMEGMGKAPEAASKSAVNPASNQPGNIYAVVEVDG